MDLWEHVAGVREDPAGFAGCYLSYVAEVQDRIDTASVARLLRALEGLRSSGRKLFIVGNGGSAATSAHMANRLGDRDAKNTQGTPWLSSHLTYGKPFSSHIRRKRRWL